MNDYYDILGITDEERKKTNDEFISLCKKKYYDLCKKWHPDKFAGKSEEEKKNAETKFKQINEAYQNLIDPQKRQRYDMGGDDSEMDFGGGFNPFDIFNRMKRNQVQKGEDVYVDVEVTFNEAYNGTTKNIKYKKKVTCHHCNGTGSDDGKEEKCPYCNGTGFVTETKQKGNMIFQNSHTCHHCNGTGKIIKNPCKHCNGSGFEEIECIESIPVPPGVFTGANLKFEGKGSSPIGNGIDGDLIITFDVSINPYFLRPDNINVIHYENIPFNDALAGCEREIQNPDGTRFKLKIPELTKDQQEFVQYGKGFVNAISNYPKRGDFKVVVNYQYPKKLSKNQKELLKNFNND